MGPLSQATHPCPLRGSCLVSRETDREAGRQANRQMPARITRSEQQQAHLSTSAGGKTEKTAQNPRQELGYIKQHSRAVPGRALALSDPSSICHIHVYHSTPLYHTHTHSHNKMRFWGSLVALGALLLATTASAYSMDEVPECAVSRFSLPLPTLTTHFCSYHPRRVARRWSRQTASARTALPRTNLDWTAMTDTPRRNHASSAP